MVDKLPYVPGIFAAIMSGGPAHGVQPINKTASGMRPRFVVYPVSRPAPATPEGGALGAVASVQAGYAEYEAVGVLDDGSEEGIACYEFRGVSNGGQGTAEQQAIENARKGETGV